MGRFEKEGFVVAEAEGRIMAAPLVSKSASSLLPPVERERLVKNTDKIINVGYVAKEMEGLLSRFASLTAFFGIVSLIIAIVEVWLLWSYDHEEFGPACNFLKVCVFSLTCVTLVFLTLYYELLYKYQKIKGQLLLKDGFFSSGLGWNYLLEFVILAFHSPPYTFREVSVYNHAGDLSGTKVFYSLDSIFTVFMWIRFYLLLRVMRYNSIFAMDVSQVFARINNVDLSTFFAVKMMVKRRPMSAFVILFTFFVFWFAFAIMVFERVGHDKFNNFYNDLWLTLVTMTTVGYGDMYPVSDYGRAFTIVAVVASFLLISLLVIGVSSNFEMNKVEEETVARIIKVDSELQVMRAAVDLIGCFWLNCQRAGYGSGGEYSKAQLKKWKQDIQGNHKERIRLFMTFWKRVNSDFATALRQFREARRNHIKFDPSMTDHMLSDQCTLLSIDKELVEAKKKWIAELEATKSAMN